MAHARGLSWARCNVSAVVVPSGLPPLADAVSGQLHGCSASAVLQQVEDTWALVGECFVYSVMDGEATQTDENTGRTQEFLLL